MAYRIVRLIVVLAAATLVPLAHAVPVTHASCMPLEPRSRLAEADAAFVGFLLAPPDSRVPAAGGGNGMPLARWTFEVQEWVKGGLGEPRIDLLAPLGTSVDFPMAPGEPVGVLVTIENGAPVSGGCSVMSPDVLRAAARPLDPPDGEGPPALLVAGSGETHLVALDTEGRVLAYGAGDGWVRDVSICPGDRRLAELAWSLETGERIVVRDLSTLETLDEFSPLERMPTVEGVGEILCRDEDGADLVVAAPGVGLVAMGAQPGTIVAGRWRRATLGPAHAIVASEGDPVEVRVVSLASGADRLLYQLPTDGQDRYGDLGSVDFSPDGERVVILDSISGTQTVNTLRVISVADGRSLFQRPIPDQGGGSTAWWIDDDHLALVMTGHGESESEQVGTVAVLRVSDGTETERWRGLVTSSDLVAGGYIFGAPQVGGGGQLAATPVGGGEARLVRSFDAPTPWAVEALRGLDGDRLGAALADRPLISLPSGGTGETPDGDVPTEVDEDARSAGLVEPGAQAGSEQDAVPAFLGGLLLVVGAAVGGLLIARRRRSRDVPS